MGINVQGGRIRIDLDLDKDSLSLDLEYLEPRTLRSLVLINNHCRFFNILIFKSQNTCTEETTLETL